MTLLFSLDISLIRIGRLINSNKKEATMFYYIIQTRSIV